MKNWFFLFLIAVSSGQFNKYIGYDDYYKFGDMRTLTTSATFYAEGVDADTVYLEINPISADVSEIAVYWSYATISDSSAATLIYRGTNLSTALKHAHGYRKEGTTYAKLYLANADGDYNAGQQITVTIPDYYPPDSVFFDIAISGINPEVTFYPTASPDSVDADSVRLWYSTTSLQNADSTALDTLAIADLAADSVYNYSDVDVDPNIWIWGYTEDEAENRSGIVSDSLKIVADTTPPAITGSFVITIDSPLVQYDIDETSVTSAAGDIQDYLVYWKERPSDPSWTLKYTTTDIVDTTIIPIYMPGLGDSIVYMISARDTNQNVTLEANSLKDTLVLPAPFKIYVVTDSTSSSIDAMRVFRATDTTGTIDSATVLAANCELIDDTVDSIYVSLFSPNDDATAWYAVREIRGGVASLRSIFTQYPAAGGETYSLRWNGDTSPDTSYFDARSGAATLDGTCSGVVGINASYGEVSNGLLIAANNQYLTVPFAGADSVDRDSGTVWFSIKTDASEDFTADGSFIEMYISSNDHIRCVIRATDERLNMTTKGGGTEEGYPSTSVINTGNWVRCAISWDITTAKVAVYDGIAAGWNESVSSTYARAAVTLDDFTLGENAVGVAFTHNIYLDNVYLVNGDYQAADPYSP